MKSGDRHYPQREAAMVQYCKCPLCGARVIQSHGVGSKIAVECSVCGPYEIDPVVVRVVENGTPVEDAYLLSGFIREEDELRNMGEDRALPLVNRDQKIEGKSPVFPTGIVEKSAKLLVAIGRRSKQYGDEVLLDLARDYPLAYVQSAQELSHILDYLQGKEKIAGRNASGASVRLTPKGTVEALIAGGDRQSANTGVENSENEPRENGTDGDGETGIIEIRLPGGTWEYNLNQQLGRRGGFGSVYAGRSRKHESVAIKQISLGQADKGRREVEIANEVLIKDEFEHIIPVLDAGNDENSGLPCIVMARAEKTLQEEIEANGPFLEERAIPILISIAKGLAEVPKLVHRDLKPANVLFHDGEWKVADFGIARFIEATTSEKTLGHLKTKNYAAPEQWSGERATKATDVYALGCIAYALLTGEPPFTGEDVRVKHLSELPPALHVSERLKSLISLMLNKEGETRPTIERVLRVLASSGGSAEEQSSGFSSLAAAGANVVEKLTKGAAQNSREAESKQKRLAMKRDAAKVLSELQESLFFKIQEAVDIAQLHERHEGVINVGDGSLHLGPFRRDYPVFDVGEFSQCNWDVITGAMVRVSQQTPKYERSASLWYARHPDSEEGYRWYEVSYFTNPIASSRRQFEPFHLCDEIAQADEAHSPVIGMVQVANKPVAIDGEDADTFLDRWARLLGDAAQGKLAPPRRMPF